MTRYDILPAPQQALRDVLLGRKLNGLLRRSKAKDYGDIAAMLEAGQSLERGLETAMTLHPMLPSCEVVRALVYFEGGDLASLSAAERATLIAHATRLRAPPGRPPLGSALALTSPRNNRPRSTRRAGRAR